MRIGLIDVDGHSGFPNLALMKLSAWHKAHGDSVEWYEPLFATDPFDKVYMSKVFTFSTDYQYPINAHEIVKGGTGYKLYDRNLPEEIESKQWTRSVFNHSVSHTAILTAVNRAKNRSVLRDGATIRRCIVRQDLRTIQMRTERGMRKDGETDGES